VAFALVVDVTYPIDDGRGVYPAVQGSEKDMMMIEKGAKA
jgi:hypothetical protein